MPAPQQRNLPVYKETANIPKPSVAYYLHQQGSGAAAGLARVLGVASKRAKMDEQNDKPSKEENLQLAALAQMGAERDRLKLAKGKSLFGYGDASVQIDSYELERGRREAALYAGQLRDAYAEAGLHKNDNPAAYQAFVQSQRDHIFNELLKDVDPSYYHGFVTHVGPVFQKMGLTHAGNLDTFIQSQNKLAAENLIQQQVDLEMTMARQGNAFTVMMDTLMGPESNNNYNAFHSHADNTSIRFTDMTLNEVLEFQSSKKWKDYGSGSSAVGRYQFVEKTLRETIRASGLDPATVKFTPAIQDRLAFTRLVTERDFIGFLEGKYTAEEYLNEHLRKEWAGLKGTDGRGFYDGDGLNKASLPWQKSVAALIQFREAYVRDPSIVKKDKKGNVIGLAEDAPVPTQNDPTKVRVADAAPDSVNDAVPETAPTPPQRLNEVLATSPEQLGVDTPEARKIAAKALVNFIQANPAHAKRLDLDDVMASWGLPKADRQMIYDARDEILEEQEAQSALDIETKRREAISMFDKAVRAGDLSSIGEVPDEYRTVIPRLKGVLANPPEVDPEFQAEFLANIRDPEYGDERTQPTHKDYPQYVLGQFMRGVIDHDTYVKAMNLRDTALKAKTVRQRPGIEPYAETLLNSIPKGKFRSDFAEAVDAVLAEYAENAEGPVPILEVFDALNKLHDTAMTKLTEAQQRVLNDPTYQ
ncbi:hypothetical protein [Maritalea mediterranea]|uniref:Uncharacterized protein n=1 Tax=Maritalea mediterranea TaxID=2909667 RepID=A0ABS9EAZ1_9HYPH|nr:hypothetical protein [Maritalea mediterranea]MCF4098611.1 hypothetical protein [Maritalea mediterranea]